MSKRNKKTNANVASRLARKGSFTLVVYLFSEGETEPRYLQDIAHGHNVKVEIIDIVSTPWVLLANARAWAYAHRSTLTDDKKQVWALFDDDEKVSDIARAVCELNNQPKDYKKNTPKPQIHVGYMKPCIELWGALCITGKGKSLPQMHKPMEAYLKKIMKGYDHEKKPYFDVSQMKQTDKAIDFAKKWERYYGPFPACVGHAPKFAGIYSLVEKICSIPQRC